MQIIYGLFNNAVSISDYISLADMITTGCRTETNVAGSICGLLQGTILTLSRKDLNHKIPQSSIHNEHKNS
jgi:hypothetical protein